MNDKALNSLVEATQAMEYIFFDVERKFTKQVLNLISVMQDGVGYVAFNDESGFPNFHDYTTDEHCNIFAIKVVTDENEHHSLKILIDSSYLEDITNDDGWVSANSWGSYSVSEIFSCLKDIMFQNKN
jgi:hypothetical protein